MSDQRGKRLLKEMQECAKDKASGIIIQSIDEGNLSHLVGSFQGPPDTPYEGGTFEVDIEVPPDYPFKPLKMKFITKVYHPNISSASGAICLDILKSAWSPVYTLKTTMVSLQSLLCSPEPKDPQDAEVAKVYMSDRAQFDETARYWTEVYAEGRKSGVSRGAKSASGSSAQQPANPPKQVDEIALAGLSRAHVLQFTSMGFDQAQVIDTLKRLNYRGANVAQITDDQVVTSLLS